MTPPANAHALLVPLRKAAPVREIAGAGHALPQEQPSIIAGLIADSVTRHVKI